MTCRISVKPFGVPKKRGERRVELVLGRTGAWLCRGDPMTATRANDAWPETKGPGWEPQRERVERFLAALELLHLSPALKAFDADPLPADARP